MRLTAYLIIAVSLVAGALSAATAYLVSLDAAPEVLSETTLGSPAGAYAPVAPGATAETLEAELAALRNERPDVAESTLVLDLIENANTSDPGTFTALVDILHAALDADKAPGAEETDDESRIAQLRTEAAKPPLDPETLDPVPEVESATPESVWVSSHEQVAPIGRAGDRLVPALVAMLQLEPPNPGGLYAGPELGSVTWVKTKSFSLARWPYSWLFLLSIVGLGGGAAIVRSSKKAARQAPAGAGDVHPASEAKQALDRITSTLNDVDRLLPSLADDRARLHAIMEYLGRLQAEEVAAFVGAREGIIGKLGMGGFAELMDRFAALERQINRAWSSAADHHIAEATSSLAHAKEMAVELAGDNGL